MTPQDAMKRLISIVPNPNGEREGTLYLTPPLKTRYDVEAAKSNPLNLDLADMPLVWGIFEALRSPQRGEYLATFLQAHKDQKAAVDWFLSQAGNILAALQPKAEVIFSRETQSLEIKLTLKQDTGG